MRITGRVAVVEMTENVKAAQARAVIKYCNARGSDVAVVDSCNVANVVSRCFREGGEEAEIRFVSRGKLLSRVGRRFDILAVPVFVMCEAAFGRVAGDESGLRRLVAGNDRCRFRLSRGRLVGFRLVRAGELDGALCRGRFGRLVGFGGRFRRRRGRRGRNGGRGRRGRESRRRGRRGFRGRRLSRRFRSESGGFVGDIRKQVAHCICSEWGEFPRCGRAGIATPQKENGIFRRRLIVHFLCKAKKIGWAKFGQVADGCKGSGGIGIAGDASGMPRALDGRVIRWYYVR